MAQQSTVRWERQPADAFRFLLSFVAFWVLAALALWWPRRIQSVSAELVALLDNLPEGLVTFVVGVLQLAAVVAPLAVAAIGLRGRRREALVTAASIVVAATLGSVVTGWLGDAVPDDVLLLGQTPSWVTGSAFPSGAYLAGAAAGITALAPVLTSSWRRAAWWTLWVVAGARVLAAAEAPINLLAVLMMGIAVGSAALFVLGAPVRRPAQASVERALARAGLHLDAIAHVEAPTVYGPEYLAHADGRDLVVKVVGRDQRDADLLNRAIRSLRVKGVEDDRPVSPRPTVEREALNTFLASVAGATVPTARAVGDTDERGAFLVLDAVDGPTLQDLPAESFDDRLLDAVFAQLRCLQDARFAHRWLSLDHLVLQPDGTVAVTELRWAEASAADEVLAADVAEVVVALATRVGADRAADAAARTLTAEQLGAALPRVQPLVLSTSTRRAAKADKGLLARVRTELQRVSAVDEYQLVQIDRLNWKRLLTLAGTVFIGYVLLGFVANWSEIWESLRQANPWALLPLLALSVFGTVTGAWSLMGAVNQRLPFMQTVVVMYAQSFLNRFTPANAGGMALRVRYLQRNGVDLVMAAGSVGLTSASSGVAQAVLFTVFLLWAGSNAPESGGSFDISASTVLVVIVLVLAAAGVLLATALGRRLWARLRINLSRVWGELRQLARQPLKMAQLFGGATLGKLTNIVMLSIALRALDVAIPFGTLGAMYMVANTVASAAPTPGGVGAIEAALTAGLVGLGVPGATAAAAVLLFRLMSFWFPVLPGWLSLRYVERTGIV